jgi:ATP-binding cassette subfamily C protein CydC
MSIDETSVVDSFPPLPTTDAINQPYRDSSGGGRFLDVLRRLLRLIAPLAGWVALSVLLGFATISSGIGLLGASAYIISTAVLRPSIAELQVAIVGVRFFGIARGVFRYLERYISHQTTFRLLARLRTWFYQALEPLAPARLLSYRTGDLLNRILGDIDSLENFYVRALAPPLTALLVAALTGLYLGGFDPRLAIITLFFMGLAGLGTPLLTRRMGRIPGRRLVEYRAGLSAALVDFNQGLTDLLINNRAAEYLDDIKDLSRAFSGARRRLADIDGFGAALVSLLANGALWIVLVLAIPLVVSGQIEGVYLAVLLLVVISSFEAIFPLPLAAQHLDENIRAAERLLELVDARPQVIDPSHPQPLPDGGVLEVESLSFSYSHDHHPDKADLPWVLQNISFRLPPGKRMAIVGPSGAGKSTIVHLLARFWEYEHGQITVDGVDLRAFHQADWRSRMAVVSQNTTLFSASLIDNLRLARPSADRNDIVAAAKNARLHDFIQTLPDGYNTWIGEHGAQLSAGQRQRLAIARALLQDAPLLILDEPTANLDALTERAIWDSFDRLLVGRSALVISHRLIGMEKMDEILVLDGGVVVERGRHKELVQSEGLYRRMWDLQKQLVVR